MVSLPTDGVVFASGYAEVLAEILRLVHERVGVNFSGYREPMLLRRLRARMALLGIADAAAYRTLVQESELECRNLADHIAVNTSSFFRDPAVWECLSHRLLPRMLDEAGPGRSLRFWSAGCAGGEEAYSLAILAAETSRRIAGCGPVTVVGSDIDRRALAAARLGRYPREAFATTTLGVLDRYFKPVPSGGFEVLPSVAHVVSFVEDNLLSHPPEANGDGVLARFHLVACRNVLIYLQAAERERLLNRLVQALVPGGYLILGTTVSPLRRPDLLVVDESHRIYQRARRRGHGV